jgi:hypothetical protein
VLHLLDLEHLLPVEIRGQVHALTQRGAP